jgi:diguanylate cyclase (GGDEF)-like protein
MNRAAIPIGLLGIAVIGWLDYLTGYELRMFPLYFAPVGYASAARGRATGVILSATSAATWFIANLLAGIQVSDRLLAANASLHFIACTWIAVLIARLRSLAASERANARSDVLTGLPNQRALSERVAIELARLHRGAGSLVVACLDLDGFKAINDRAGHAAGDRALQEVADVLREHLREGDLPARTGGDEFVLLLPDTDREQGRAALERIREAIAARLRDVEVPVTASIGAIVSHPPGRTAAQALLTAADDALYHAKRSGRNRVHLA